MDEHHKDPDAAKRPGGSAGEQRMPGWVKGFVVAGIAVGVVVLVALLIGSGDHGPGRHSQGDQRAAVAVLDGLTPQTRPDHR